MWEVEGYPPLHTMENCFMSLLLSSLLNLTASVSQTFRSYDILKMRAVFLSEMKVIDNNLHFYVIMMLLQLTLQPEPGFCPYLFLIHL